MKKAIQIDIFGLKTIRKKICIKCRKIKNENEYYKKRDNIDGLRTECKTCCAEVQREYRIDPKRERKYNLKKKFNMTSEDFDQMLKEQNGMCKICGTKTPRGKGTFHVDHSHKTGKIRGLLCNNCNAVLGFSNDNPFILMSAIRYLKLN